MKGTGGFAIYLNVGEAKPHALGEDPPPLTPAFKHLQLPVGLLDTEAAVAVAATDLERDGDRGDLCQRSRSKSGILYS